jgi:hypothetical protein
MHQSLSSSVLAHVTAQFSDTGWQLITRFHFVYATFKEFEYVDTLVWIFHVEDPIHLEQAIETLSD